MENEKIELISFTAEEHKHYHRSIDFYWTIGIIAVVLCVFAFIARDGLFGVLLLIGTAMYGYSSWKRPVSINIILTNKDLTIGGDEYLLSKIEAFRILDIKGEKELVFSVRRSYQPIVSVCVPDEMAVPLKENLLRLLPEDEKLVPHIGRRFMARYKI